LARKEESVVCGPILPHHLWKAMEDAFAPAIATNPLTPLRHGGYPRVVSFFESSLWGPLIAPSEAQSLLESKRAIEFVGNSRVQLPYGGSMKAQWSRWAILTGIVVICVGCKQRNDSQFVVGAVLPMTGDAGSFGQNAARGAELAVKDANNQHLLPGRTVVFQVEDSRGTAPDAVSAATKLIDITHAQVLVGDVTSAGTQAIIPIVTRALVPLISPAASDPSLTGASVFFSRDWPSDVYEAVVIGGYARSSAYHRISILYANTDYGLGMTQAFENALGSQSIILKIPADRETPDYRPTIQRIKNAQPDAIFMVLYPEDAKRFLQQLAEQGIQLPLLATATFEDPSLATSALADHVVFASPVPPNESSAERSGFVSEYTKNFQTAPGVLSDTGYDAAMILIKAEATSGAHGPESVATYIHSLRNYQGVSGEMTFDAAGDVQKPYGLKTVRSGKFVWLNRP
jgi:branched-chain amino acid transport system substrate-binding protein